MKIALIGYGKMGKAIEQIAMERGHEVILRITSSNKHSLTNGDLSKADVAIEFTRPDSAIDNIYSCFHANVPVVCGTTGWQSRLKDVKDSCHKKDQALLYASNFSIGVNLFFAINRYAAQLFNDHPDYRVSIEEIHHVHKLDAPSGTAITLAETIIAEHSGLSSWTSEDNPAAGKVPVKAIRTDEVPGTHSAFFSSEIDTIELKHTAHNRKGFAFGAVIAAEWLRGKTGCYTMQDVLNLPKPDGSNKK